MSAELPEGFGGEHGLYEWPCIRCGRLFKPMRLDMLPNKPFAKVCSTCGWKSLSEFLEETEDAE